MHKQFIVKGRVQGVYYRVSTQKQAQLLALKGWVRNQTNGDVLLRAAGDNKAMQQLEAWLWQGPERAKVDDVQISILDDTTGLEYDGFIIKPDQI